MHPISTQPNSAFLRKDPQPPSQIASQHRQPASTGQTALIPPPHTCTCISLCLARVPSTAVYGSCAQHGCAWLVCPAWLYSGSCAQHGCAWLMCPARLYSGSCTQHGCILAHVPSMAVFGILAPCWVALSTLSSSALFLYLLDNTQYNTVICALLVKAGHPRIPSISHEGDLIQQSPSSEPQKSAPIPQLLVPFCLLADSGFWVFPTGGRIAPTSRLWNNVCGTITTAWPAGPRDPHSVNRWPRLRVAKLQASPHPLSRMGCVWEPNRLSHVILPASWAGADGTLVNITSGQRECVLPKSTSTVSEWEPGVLQGSLSTLE